MLSYKENIPIILGVVEELNPKSVLDVGAGFGKYGLLIREQYLSSKASNGELSPVDDIRIDAIEDTDYFVHSRAFTSIYNMLIVGDAFRNVKDGFLEETKYDLILMIDVIEHHPKEKVLDFLKTVSQWSNILISTPKHTVMYEEKYYGDERHHMSQWEMSDFSAFHDIKTVENPLSHIFIIPRQ